VAWDHSRIDGFTGKVNLVEHNGSSAFVVMAHTNAIYFPPGVGGVLLTPGAAGRGRGVLRRRAGNAERRLYELRSRKHHGEPARRSGRRHRDPLNNPARVAPRHLFDLGLGTDNLLHTDKAKLRLRFSVINLTNKEALYNFLSTFSGTHFVTPRAYQVQAGVTF
jgi:hypothetical protein